MSPIDGHATAGRVEHAVFGCPEDLGFRLVGSSVTLREADRSTLTEYADQKKGPLLQGRAITLVRLTRWIAVLVSHTDSAPNLRQARVVSHVFLVTPEDYDGIACDPFAILAEVVEKCDDRLPDHAALAFDLALRPPPRVERLHALPLTDGEARILAPFLAALLTGAEARCVVVPEFAERAAEVAIGLMPLERRRSFTLATRDFSVDAHRAQLLGTDAAPVAARRTSALVEEVIWLLGCPARFAADAAEIIERNWPTHAPEAELTEFLSTWRGVAEAEDGGDFVRMLEHVRVLVKRAGAAGAMMPVASRLLARALLADGAHREDVLALVPRALESAARRDLLGQLLEPVVPVLLAEEPCRSVAAVATVVAACGATDRASPFPVSVESLVESALVQPDEALPARLEWVVRSGGNVSDRVLGLVEGFAWRRESTGLRQAVASIRRQVAGNDAVFFESRLDLLVGFVATADERAIAAWYDRYDTELGVRRPTVLDRLLCADCDGHERSVAVRRTLDGLRPSDAKAIWSRLGGWLDVCPGPDVLAVVEWLAAGLRPRPNDPTLRLLREVIGAETPGEGIRIRAARRLLALAAPIRKAPPVLPTALPLAPLEPSKTRSRSRVLRSWWIVLLLVAILIVGWIAVVLAGGM
ncbi:MAG: hypothetical protein KDE27_30995 [Planctomycetes bacterium]|nr:hypothetical protein [Planctomycetota bacterium]